MTAKMIVSHATWPDYLVFTVIMLISLVTGIYFSFDKNDPETYLYGNRKMSVFPVSTSLVVSFISAITMQGVPAEIFVYGVQYILMEISIVGMWVAALTFVPLYYPLRLTSVYQYLDMRFQSRPVVLFAYIMGLLTANFYMGIIIYAPATAFESIVLSPTWLNILLISLTSTIYTAIGGMKAVVWNDTFQALVMVIGLAVVIVVGTLRVGGISEVWHELQVRERTHVDYVPDPTIRTSFWFGILSILPTAGIYTTQPALMRFNTVSSIKKAQQMMYLGSFGKFFISLLAILAGAVVLAYYSKIGCEPMATGAIDNPNQILPYFLVDAMGLPGIPGLFIASVVAASLSTMSTLQNAMSAVAWKEVISPFVGPVTDVKETIILKLIVVVFGVISTIVAFFARYLGGTLIQIAIMVMVVTDVPAISLFFIGAMFTFTSGGAALISCISCIFLYGCLEIGRYLTNSDWPKPPLIAENCTVMNTSIIDTTVSSDNVTYSYFTTSMPEADANNSWNIFLLSPYLYGAFGLFFTVGFAVILSLFPCLRYKKPVPAKLLFPFLKSFGSLSERNTFVLDDMVTIDDVLGVNENKMAPEFGNREESSGLLEASNCEDLDVFDNDEQPLAGNMHAL